MLQAKINLSNMVFLKAVSSVTSSLNFIMSSPPMLMTHALSINNDPFIAPQTLQSHFTDLEEWWHNWIIKINSNKSHKITFKLTVPVEQIRYLRLHLE